MKQEKVHGKTKQNPTDSVCGRPFVKGPNFKGCKLCEVTPKQCCEHNYGVFTLDVESMLHVNLGGILGGTQC
jgi:hypothetical protein